MEEKRNRSAAGRGENRERRAQNYHQNPNGAQNYYQNQGSRQGQGGRNYQRQPQGGPGYQGQPRGGGYYQGQPQGGPGYQGQPQGGGYYQGQPQGGPGYYQGQDPQGYYQGGPQRGYEEPDGRKNSRKKKKKKHRKLMFVLEIILLLVLALGLFAFAQLSRVDRVKLKDVLVNAGIQKEGFRNLALFGVDSRSGELESGTNSDTIMVCSINEKTGEIKLVSVYRDTYLDLTNGSYNKANSAYAGGGAERAINMLNKNLDLDIKDFATVDFNAVIKAVDLLGGIDIELTDEEVKWLNAYLVETSQVTGVSYEDVPGSGLQHLTGIQAMAYCRIRYTEGWDYKRTERQRIVLEKIFEKAQHQGVTALAGLVNTMLPYIETSLSNTEMIALAADIGKYSIGETIGFPYEKQGADISAGDCVVPVNLAANVTRLHQELFGDMDYTPSDTVQEISYQIISETGIQ